MHVCRADRKLDHSIFVRQYSAATVVGANCMFCLCLWIFHRQDLHTLQSETNIKTDTEK